MTADALRSIRRLIAFLDRNQDRLAIDADTHATDPASLTGSVRERYESEQGYYHGRRFPRRTSCGRWNWPMWTCPHLADPAATSYTGDPDADTERLLERTATCAIPRNGIQQVHRRGWTDPKACGLAGALKIAETCVVEFGFPIVKLNPAQNRFPIDSPESYAWWTGSWNWGAVPAFHFGADTPFTPAEGLEAVARRHPERPVLAVHMGGGGAGYLEAEDSTGRRASWGCGSRT